MDNDKLLAQAIRDAGQDILNGLLQVSLALQSLAPPKATKLTLKYTFKGETIMGAPVSGTVGQVFNPTVVESNPTTPIIPPIGPLVYASDTPSVVSVDPNTGVATCVAAGSANVSVIDQGNNLTDSVPFTVAGTPPPPPPAATSLTLTYNPEATIKR